MPVTMATTVARNRKAATTATVRGGPCGVMNSLVTYARTSGRLSRLTGRRWFFASQTHYKTVSLSEASPEKHLKQVSCTGG
jgi:hypothetical protein